MRGEASEFRIGLGLSGLKERRGEGREGRSSVCFGCKLRSVNTAEEEGKKKGKGFCIRLADLLVKS